MILVGGVFLSYREMIFPNVVLDAYCFCGKPLFLEYGIAEFYDPVVAGLTNGEYCDTDNAIWERLIILD